MFAFINLILTVIILIRLFKYNNFFVVEQKIDTRNFSNYGKKRNDKQT